MHKLHSTSHTVLALETLHMHKEIGGPIWNITVIRVATMGHPY